jgi:hypothetical protein
VTKIFVKPSGVEVEINSDNYHIAKALGWVPKEESHVEIKTAEVIELPKRKGRPPKIK